MKPFEQLLSELDEWNFVGEEAVFWWRDDDAVAASPELDRMGSLAARLDVPLALAVIPARLEQDLLPAVASHPGIIVVQHGVAHDNHARAGTKKQELIASVPGLLSDLEAGVTELQNTFGDRFCPVLVPPWNRIDSALYAELGGLGFKGLSCFTPRDTDSVDDKVWLVNTHVDVINWKGGRRFVGEQQAIDQMVGHLRGKRTGKFDRAEPTGLLTHHLVHDEATWQFLRQLLDVLDQHPAVTWLSVERVFQTRWR